jgi:hypothetical protein
MSILSTYRTPSKNGRHRNGECEHGRISTETNGHVDFTPKEMREFRELASYSWEAVDKGIEELNAEGKRVSRPALMRRLRQLQAAVDPLPATSDEQDKSNVDSIYFVREDWTHFRTLQGLSQKSGVPLNQLSRLVAKELADNSLDAGSKCEVGEMKGGGFFVQDNGPGIPGTPEDIAYLFSIKRPLTSSKMIRLPSRGCLGNGLRVVAGAVLASGGKLRVFNRNQRLDLMPLESGDTKVECKSCDWPQGTRIEVRLGKSIPEDQKGSLIWAKEAISAAGDNPIYSGKTSSHWYDSDGFFELLQSAGDRPVYEVLNRFRSGCDDSRPANSLSSDDAEALLHQLRKSEQPLFKPLNFLASSRIKGSYAKTQDMIEVAPGRGQINAKLPISIECWCTPAPGDGIMVLVNRTPITGDVRLQREKNATATIFGCNLGYGVKVGREPVVVTLNIQAPFFPMTTDGKEPDLDPFSTLIIETIEKAASKCQRENRTKAELNGFLPVRKRGRQTEEGNSEYEVKLEKFVERLKQIESTLDFRPGSRGWAYILENAHLITKGEIDKAEALIVDCRKTGWLPLNFCAEDEARAADNVEVINACDPKEFAKEIANHLIVHWKLYSPVSFWDFQKVAIYMVVEKIDLKTLFSPICAEYHVEIRNARGWSDKNMLAAMMRWFKAQEEKGRLCILLYCGDLDPKGIQMSELIKQHMKELEKAVGWNPDKLIVERFGLNADFIEKYGLTWIDGLITSSGEDLADPDHKHHNAPYVQDYIGKYGARKVEANVLVVQPQAGRQLCRDAIEKHLDFDGIKKYERYLTKQRKQCRLALPGAVKAVMRELNGSNQ